MKFKIFKLVKKYLSSFISQLSSSKGQSMVELLIAIGLASLLLPSLFTSMLSTREGRAQKDQRFEAVSLLKEASEALRVVREKDWSYVSVNGEYHPEISGTSWVLLPNQEASINGFTRKITISDVERDNFGTGKIVESGGTIDPSTKKAVIRVSWSTPSSSFVESMIYLTRFKNQAYKETTVGDFDGGIKTGTVVIDTEGGEIILTAGGRGEWCEPNLVIQGIDLPKQGVANALTAIEGQAFAGTGENASGVSFANVEISNPPYPTPPAGNVVGTFDGYKTNDVFGEENYAYIATDNNSKEVVIINLTQKDQNNKYAESGYFNAPGNVSAESVFVLGNIGYATVENKLYTFDLSIKSGSRPKIGEVPLASSGKKVYVVSSGGGTYAYVAVDSELTQMQIIDVSNPGTPIIVGQARLNADDGASLFVNSTGTRAYLVTETSSKKEFFIIDVSTKTGDRPVVASYDTSGMDPKGVTAATNNKAIVVGHGGQEYQVFDLSSGKCGGLNIDTGVNGVSTVIESDGDIYAYIITGDANAELKILEGGPGGAYSSTGVFESKTFDAGKEVSFNSFSAVASKTSQTDVKYQIGITKGVSGDCSLATFTFVGPDRTDTSYFATSSAIPTSPGPGYENPGRCLRYKAFLSTQDITQTSVFHEIIFNYSL